MTELEFYTLDVFTDRLFGGNQLAVFPGAPELEAAVMQSIAREFNLSETVFVRHRRWKGHCAGCASLHRARSCRLPDIRRSGRRSCS
jgi:hypothetical protein